MSRIIFAVSFVALFSIIAFSQNTPTPTPTLPAPDGETVRISTSLIQIDATVVDKDGKVVTDLTADDFEVFENDVKQTVTNLSFIAEKPGNAEKALPKNGKESKNSIPVPPVPVRLRSDQVRRTMALIIDDLGLSFANVFFVKNSLKKFVDEQMQEGDLVAIVTTGGGMGALQQFTSDKRMLYASIDRIKFNVQRETWSFEPIKPTMKEELNASMNAFTGETQTTVGTAEDKQFDIGLSQQREDVFAVGTLGAVNYVIRSMQQLPGRKAMMLFSEGFNLMQAVSMNPNSSQTEINPRIEGAFRNIIDAANRSGVIIYAVDPRGLVNTGMTAEDSMVGNRDNILAGADNLRAREEKLLNTQHSLKYITEATGGFAVINNNNINKGIERMLDDQKGYYLIGYQPDEDTFDPIKRRYNKLTVKLKRPGLKIRYRSGFFGVSDAATAAAKSSEQKLLDALTSPFASGQIRLDLTTLFANDAKTGPFMRSLLHINGADLNFTDEGNGWHQAKFEILAANFGENGAVEDLANRTGLIRLRDEAFQEVKEKGLVYSLVLPLKKPGAYQMRVALRDLSNSKVGSANQFIEVPNLKKKRLVLSGLLLENSADREKTQKGRKNILQSEVQRDRAVRTFRAGTSLMFGASIYNAKISSQPNLSTQFRIYRNNQEIFASEESLININGRQSEDSIDIGGTFGLGQAMPPGEYILQVLVKDPTKSNSQLATQWIDFEITK